MSREDLSYSVVHLCKDDYAKSTLWQILRDRRINASTKQEIVDADPLGAACFYDAPRRLDSIIETNPSKRRGYGIIVGKKDLWRVGGRPVIYTDPRDGAFDRWPTRERFRLVRTRPDRKPPVDWMHEREWRTRGPLDLTKITIWHPCVSLRSEVQELAQAFPDIDFIESIEGGAFFEVSGGEIVGEWDDNNPMLSAEDLRKLSEDVDAERDGWEREDRENRAKERLLRTPTGEIVGTGTGYVGTAGDIIQSDSEPRKFWRVLEFGHDITVEEITEDVARRKAKPPEYPSYLELLYEGKMVKGDELTRILTERIREGR
ncbi:MAG: hypothetical protein Q8P41_26905 [Pseudomonadota bacterium]|nr:hypothetical protein [Pseudomonadota bacterium]